MTGRSVDAMRVAALCGACGERPKMRDWSDVPMEAADDCEWAADADDRPRFCLPCWWTRYRDPQRLSDSQTTAALETMARPRSAFVRWPFPELHALTGPLPPKTVHYVAAASGGGKSTFITSAIDRWLRDGVRVDVLPLEADPWDWRKQMASVRAGVPPGDILSGEMEMRADDGDRDAERTLDAVRDELRAMQREARAHGLLGVHPDRRITARRLGDLMTVVAARGAQVVVIDHIDHIAPDPDARGGGNALNESQKVNNAVLDFAKDLGLVVVAMSQLNASRLRGHRDRLAKYGVPQTSDLFMHTFKEHNANTILGLFRPLAPDADADLLSRARSGEVEPHSVLAPGVMGVALLKSRPYGSREGKRAYLTVERGAARDRTADEAREWEAASAGVRTGDEDRGRRPGPRLAA